MTSKFFYVSNMGNCLSVKRSGRGMSYTPWIWLVTWVNHTTW